MLYNVREVFIHSKRSARSKFLGIPNNCWIDVPYPVSAAVMGFENILKAYKLDKSLFRQPKKYTTYVLVQDEKMQKKWIFSLKRKKRNEQYETYVEQIIFFQSKM
jgi:hypothetical protein